MTPTAIEEALREIELNALGKLTPEWAATRSTADLLTLAQRYREKWAALELEDLPFEDVKDMENYTRMSRLGTAYLTACVTLLAEFQRRQG